MTNRRNQMKDPKAVFEAIMRSKGQTDFDTDKHGRYTRPNMQTRWNYFLLGWEMRGAI